MENLNLGTEAYATSSPSAQSPPASPTVVDKDGDLYLVVGSAQRAFQVDSRALIRVSRVWKSMVCLPHDTFCFHPLCHSLHLQLTGGWAESRPENGAWVVHWPENDPQAIEILLHIVHLHQSRVPQTLSLDDVFRIAIVVDMYDLARCLGLWPRAWCESSASTLEGLEFEDLTKLAWVGWVFGNTMLFERVLERMVVEIEVDGEGRPVDAAGTPLEELTYLKAMDVIGKWLR